MATLHTTAMTSAVLSGAYALVALCVGTPLEFGVGLALCGAFWLAADLTDWPAAAARSPHRRPAPAAQASHLVWRGVVAPSGASRQGQRTLAMTASSAHR